MDRAFVTLSGATYAQGPQVDTKGIVEFQLDNADQPPIGGPTMFVKYTGTGFASAVGLAAGPDGLYFTDLYKDQPQVGDLPSAAGANIYRIRYFGVPTPGTGTGFEAEYFATPDLTGPSLKRTDPAIDFFWPGGTSPDPSLPHNGFSVRWRGQIQPPTTDPYTLTTTSDDGVRVWLDGALIINNWTDHAATDDSATVPLIAGQKYLLVMEYYDSASDATARLAWASPSHPKEVIPQSQVYAPAAPAPPSPPARKSKKSCGATGLEVVIVFLVLRAIRRAY
jgi:hypothetical protein